MEQLEIHNRSYLVRWVNVRAEQTVSWTVRPEKRSINFGLFKHPGSGIAPNYRVPSAMFEAAPSPALNSELTVTGTTTAHGTSSKTVEKLRSTGLKLVRWYGTYEANRNNTGIYDVSAGEGGMYALVFDNTFSKQHGKKATFVLLTYPTMSPPQTDHYIQQNQIPARGSAVNPKSTSEQKVTLAREPSADLVLQTKNTLLGEEQPEGQISRIQQWSSEESNTNLFTGSLQKRRRRRHQGWARRFFSLDYSTATLSYYKDRNASSLRGAIPLSLAAIGANAATRQISIDSGAEVWHLKAPSQKDFSAWKYALEKAHAPVDPKSPGTNARGSSFKRRISIPPPEIGEQREWARVDELLNRLKGSRDSAMIFAKDTDPKYSSPQSLPPLGTISGYSSASESPSEQSTNSYFAERSREPCPFWKRKTSGGRQMPGAFKRSVSATPSVPDSHCNTPAFGPSSNKTSESGSKPSGLNTNVHNQWMSLLRDLDSIVADFDLLVHENKQRRERLLNSAVSRHSLESQDDEFFDAENFHSSQLLNIYDETDEELTGRSSVSSSASSKGGMWDSFVAPKKGPHPEDPAFPSKADSLEPLPAPRVNRRVQVQCPMVAPPSLIGFLRRNVGKDLSTISMPVSANEPISLLQRAAEAIEYSTLLDSASKADSSAERLLFVTAFAISHLSSSRVKERTIRKPFNPLLGETFELVREDRNFRFLAEKVSHHPVQLACQAESPDWCLTQSPRPSQKFWGKSIELLTEGKLRLVLHTTGEHFSWGSATSFLRNIIAGERYLEPVGSMSVVNETKGENCVVSFKAGGMFSGRSEELIAQLYNADGTKNSLGLMGKWTTSLVVTEQDTIRSKGNPIWTAGDLSPDVTKRYGFTTYAAGLNEITSLEDGKIAPTDSRLRPDQRAAEENDLDNAEAMKATLEQAQRQRRQVMLAEGGEVQPRWFEKGQAADGEEVWVQKKGKDSYWSRRQQSNWEGVAGIFDVQ